MSNQSPSTESSPPPLARGQANNDHDQASGSARAPGTRTPRRVQWASAVDEDEIAGRLRDRGPENEAVSNHELDGAGLDVCMFSPPAFFTYSFLS
jgi:hypothetical protein